MFQKMLVLYLSNVVIDLIMNSTELRQIVQCQRNVFYFWMDKNKIHILSLSTKQIYRLLIKWNVKQSV